MIARCDHRLPRGTGFAGSGRVLRRSDFNGLDFGLEVGALSECRPYLAVLCDAPWPFTVEAALLVILFDEAWRDFLCVGVFLESSRAALVLDDFRRPSMIIVVGPSAANLFHGGEGGRDAVS